VQTNAVGRIGPLRGLFIMNVIGGITMSMNGKVIAVRAEGGQNVSEDDELVIIEAMRMELPVVATEEGTVKEIRAKVGESDTVGEVLEVIEQ